MLTCPRTRIAASSASFTIKNARYPNLRDSDDLQDHDDHNHHDHHHHNNDGDGNDNDHGDELLMKQLGNAG